MDILSNFLNKCILDTILAEYFADEPGDAYYYIYDHSKDGWQDSDKSYFGIPAFTGREVTIFLETNVDDLKQFIVLRVHKENPIHDFLRPFINGVILEQEMNMPEPTGNIV